jgi:hypothetical protein
VSRTKTDEALTRAITEHADDPERAEVLRRTRAFKSSWLELAESLQRVREEARYEAWGYDNFEAYVRRELHLTPQTAEKLCGSFGFLNRHAPEVLERDGVSEPIPAFRSVDFLARAYDTPCPREKRDEIRHAVLDEGLAPAALTRRFRDAVFPQAEGADRGRVRGQLLSAARRVAQLLGEPHGLPRGLAEDVEETIGRLVLELDRTKS